MLTGYNTIFCIIYTWNKKYFKRSQQPILNSVLFISLLSFVNFISVIVLFELIFKFSIFNLIDKTEWNWVFIILTIILLTYLYCTKAQLPKKAIEYLQTGGNIKIERRVGIYIAVSVVAFLSIIVILLMQNVK